MSKSAIPPQGSKEQERCRMLFRQVSHQRLSAAAARYVLLCILPVVMALSVWLSVDYLEN